MNKQYIGDSVYVDWNGHTLVLTTEDGVHVTNTIVLEAEVWSSLVDYTKRLELELQGEVE